MPVVIAALKTELITDPTGIGYAPNVAAGNYLALAAQINLVRATISVRRPDISPAEMLEAIDSRDFVASPNIAFCSWFESLTQFPRVRLLNDDGSNTLVIGNLARLLTDTNGSRTRLQAIASRTGSRAEQLWGFGVTVTEQNVADALNS